MAYDVRRYGLCVLPTAVLVFFPTATYSRVVNIISIYSIIVTISILKFCDSFQI